MNTRFVAMALLAFVLGISSALAQREPHADPSTPKTAGSKLTAMDLARKSIQKMGATIDANKSNAQTIVSIYSDPRGGKTTIIVVNDRAKNVLGLYVYDFGSLKDAANREEVYRYLLSANDAITIGAFFVDGEDDIGYKYLMNIGQSLNQPAFESSYLMMAAVARDRRPELRKLLGTPANKADRAEDGKNREAARRPQRDA